MLRRIVGPGLPEALQTHLSTEKPPGEYTKRLIDAANANGGRDNISVIIVRVGTLRSPISGGKSSSKAC